MLTPMKCTAFNEINLIHQYTDQNEAYFSQVFQEKE